MRCGLLSLTCRKAGLYRRQGWPHPLHALTSQRHSVVLAVIIQQHMLPLVAHANHSGWVPPAAHSQGGLNVEAPSDCNN